MLYSTMIGVAIVLIFPAIWMFFTSFKPYRELFNFPPTFFPQTLYFNYYRSLLTASLYPRWFFNTTIVTVLQVLVSVFVSSLAGYGFAKKEFPGRDYIFLAVLSAMMVPFVVLMIPNFITIFRLGLINTYPALILPWVSHPFGVFIMRQYCKTVPSVLIDAARIDGSSEFGIYFRIILPLAKPALLTLGTLNFMWTWNLLLWPLVVVNKPEMMTIPLALTHMKYRGNIIDWGLLCTGGFLSIIPIIIVFVFAQKFITKGLTMGAIR